MAKQDNELRDEALETGTRVYELGFHIDPELPTEEVKKTFADIRARISALGALVAEGEPRHVQLAYTISRQETSGRRDFDAAYFSWIAYEASPEAHEELVAAARADKRLVRFIDLSTTKEAAKHAEELRALADKTPEADAEADAADAELDAALESATL